MKENKEVCPLGITEVSSDMEGRVARVGWLLCTAAETLRAFVERVFANFCKHFFFYNCGKTGNIAVAKRLTHTQAHSLKHPFTCLDIYFYFTKLLFYEISLKAIRKL